MNSVRIVADSGCDLPPALAAEYRDHDCAGFRALRPGDDFQR